MADEVRYSIMPIVIGNGIRFFDRLDQDVALHLAEVKAYTSGMVALRYEVQKSPPIDGEMEITIEGGKHSYELRYTLPDA